MAKRVLIFILLFLFSMNPGIARAESAPAASGADIMIICAHPGDEFLFLGGILPLYAGEEMKSAVVVYLSSESEAQREQAKGSLAVYGNRVQAVFGSFADTYTSTKEEALEYWDMQEVTAYLVNVIRQYKPQIVVTHDKLGEYGHGAHCVAFDATYRAVPYAAETGRCPESQAAFGTWNVQRFFSHLYGERLVSLNRENALANAGGKTALELDQQCYQTYEENYPIQITDGPGYTCAKYGLVFPENDTTLDVTAGDLFAGLDSSALAPTPMPTASPTSTPEAALHAKQQAAATETPVLTPTLSAAKTTQQPGTPTIWLAVLAALTLAAFGLAIFLKREKRAKRVFALLGCAFAAAIALSALFANEGAFAHIALWKTVESTTATPQPTAPIPTQTPEPAKPTSTPDPWDQYFRKATDPEEVVVTDPVHEHWEYRSDTLSILINRVHTARADGKPICYCIADIHMRGEDAFRAGVRNENPKAKPELEQAWHMARRYRAVLGIAGDNLTHSEVELKGILMRNGIVYSANQAQDTLAMIPQDLTMRVYKPNSISAQELLDMGIVNSFSFGPTLLNDGVRDLNSKRSNLGRENPRSGIGMVEPGHFIVITVDGRQKDYSFGVTLAEFAQLFYLNGCQIAYNLDGGSTTVMIFMGECLNQHSGVDSDVQRPMMDGLFWGSSELVPTVDDSIYNDGSKPWKMPPDA